MEDEEIRSMISQEPRVLPVFLLLDISGSMSQNGKIQALNIAVNSMLKTFSSSESCDAAISVSIITFGEGGAKLYRPLSDCSSIKEVSFAADGNTPMGAAISLAKQQIENKAVVTSRAYRPTVVLVSDGMPNDAWQKPLEDFKENGRTAKCFRMAMSIGAEEGTEAFGVLKGFVSNGMEVFKANNADDIKAYFRFVTMSVTSRSVSQNPNVLPTDVSAPKTTGSEDDPKE